MTPETPLTEVAAYLPRQAAQLLMNEPAGVQQFVLEGVRAVFVVWEGLKVRLDPVSLDVALTGFVPTLISIAHSFHETLQHLNGAMQQADTLIRELGERLATLAAEEEARDDRH